MEERILDDDGRLIRLKKTASGGVDAVEDTDGAEDVSPEDEELLLEFADSGELDEDMAGLTAAQLREALAKRERAMQEAKEESEKLAAEGAELLEKEDFDGAAEKFGEALLYDRSNEEAGKGVWIARTRDFTDLEPLLGEEAADLSESAFQRNFVLERAGDRLAALRTEYRSEEEALAPDVERDMETRRQSFRANRKYYLVRFLGFFAALVLSLIAVAVSASYIYTTKSPAPVVCSAAFGIAAFAMLVFAVVYSRKLLVAHRLCRANEDLSSTEKGARLADLRTRLAALDAVFSDGNGESEGSEEGEEA